MKKIKKITIDNFKKKQKKSINLEKFRKIILDLKFIALIIFGFFIISFSINYLNEVESINNEIISNKSLLEKTNTTLNNLERQKIDIEEKHSYLIKMKEYDDVEKDTIENFLNSTILRGGLNLYSITKEKITNDDLICINKSRYKVKLKDTKRNIASYEKPVSLFLKTYLNQISNIDYKLENDEVASWNFTLKREL